ncbi:efflux RND transporter periplasmic adaptor subunit [Parazoarcus communis]|uniref:Efflux transporter periplasmic adaptor subunit n=1 Tax=Parazoarcus communis SWub3 = DSM 12120 TaxID=1121029 RepID=A0A323UTY4_9RHOO|nr:efflux RND transporter periplasmic adaptor subunit [Parazoarcus communis]NMG72820.1 efflux RND transporter periplasmic adaptor subunit [Parazoarcus communis SWub3 = DSM 12120]PZA15945.1 efflux transporter periplasmic adaptor subunit [Azoarcus communis] [Parazoarcus communis SWub3 = DSM 12120]
MPFLRKPYALATAVALTLALGGGLATLAVQAGPQPATAVAPAAAVDVATVASQHITDWHNYSGRLEAVDRVEIRPQVSGTIVAVHFEDGALVRKGDPLFTIDPRPYAAVLEQARAGLAAAEARAAYTANDLARAERLIADNAIARRVLDEKENAAREAAANRLAARAAVESARLNLEYTRITAPVSGRVSRAEVTVGNVVAAGAGSPPLTTLVSVARIYAAFDVDEQSYLALINGRQSGAGVPVHLGLANEDDYPRRGVVSSVDNRMDTSSGTIRVRAVFDNPDGTLLPGLYARIRLGSSNTREALLIDERAIGTDQNKRFVLVVDDANRTAYREVSLGGAQSSLRVVEDGLQAGERIVVNGLQRTRPGQTVSPNPVLMSGSPHPTAPSARATTADNS